MRLHKERVRSTAQVREYRSTDSENFLLGRVHGKVHKNGLWTHVIQWNIKRSVLPAANKLGISWKCPCAHVATELGQAHWSWRVLGNSVAIFHEYIAERRAISMMMIVSHDCCGAQEGENESVPAATASRTDVLSVCSFGHVL